MRRKKEKKKSISSWLSHFRVTITNSADSSSYKHRHKGDAFLANGNTEGQLIFFVRGNQSRFIKWLGITVHTYKQNLKDLSCAIAWNPWSTLQLHIAWHWCTLQLVHWKDNTLNRWNKIPSIKINNTADSTFQVFLEE